MKVEWFEEAYNWKNPEDLYKVCIEQQKEIKRLTKRLEESQLAYLQVEKDKQRLYSIIEEVREYIEENINENEAKFYGIPDYKVFKGNIEHVLEILDKENK